MSSILKALKKLEQERAGQREGTVNIALDVIKGSERRRRSPRILLLVAVAAIFLATGVIAWWYATPLTGMHDQFNTTVRGQESTSVPPAAAVTAEPVRRSQTSAATNVRSAPEARAVVQNGTSPTPRAEEPFAAAPPQNAAATAAAPPVSQLEGYRLSEIIFHAEADQRLAIINDLPVMEGVAIDAAVVRRIGTDEVELELDGSVYSLRLPGR